MYILHLFMYSSLGFYPQQHVINHSGNEISRKSKFLEQIGVTPNKTISSNIWTWTEPTSTLTYVYKHQHLLMHFCNVAH